MFNLDFSKHLESILKPYLDEYKPVIEEKLNEFFARMQSMEDAIVAVSKNQEVLYAKMKSLEEKVGVKEDV